MKNLLKKLNLTLIMVSFVATLLIGWPALPLVIMVTIFLNFVTEKLKGKKAKEIFNYYLWVIIDFILGFAFFYLMFWLKLSVLPSIIK